MANFNTHLNVAVISSGLASAALLSATHIDFNSALWLWFLGIIGGLLPDIDSDNSTSLDTIYGMFTLTAVLVVLKSITGQPLSFIQLIITALLVYGIMRYLIRPLFEKVTVHRGSCHSLLFLLLAALLVTLLTCRLNHGYTAQADIIAWLSGGFVFFGGLIHLLLDEIYSVDLCNVRVKRSFGTALKLADFNNKSITLLIIIGITGLAYVAPSPENTINCLSSWTKFKL